MRPAWFATLMLFWVAAVAVHAQPPAGGHPPAGKKAPPPSRKEPKSRWTSPGDRITLSESPELTMRVVGTWQKTTEDAMRAALEKAQNDLLVYFQSKDPSFRWKPDLEFIRKNLLKTDPEEPEFREFDEPDVGWMQRYELEVQVSRRARDEILRRDHDYRQKQESQLRKEIAAYRMHGLEKVFGVVVALLAGVAGYIRLDELTKGYYTNWLRLAAASLVGAAGAGFWFLA